MDIIVTDSEINDISYQLKQIYYAVIIEQECVSNNNSMMDIIVEVVEHNNGLLQMFTMTHSDSSYSINFDEELVRDFFNRIEDILRDIGNVAYKFNDRIQNISDIMAIIVPYTLGKMSVSSDEMLLFVGLAIGISKIVVGTLAKRYEKSDNEIISKDELRDICLMNLEVLKNLNKANEIQKYTEEINMILSRIDND